MEMEEFTRDLPEGTDCPKCRREIRSLDWYVGRFGAHEWMGICIVRCPKCRVSKVAAAGSNHEAHHRAQVMRFEVLTALDRGGQLA